MPSGKAMALLAGSEKRKFFIIFFLLTLAYGLWLVPFWPGVLGEDSYAILREVLSNGELRSGKTAFWYYFVKLAFGTTRRIEVPIIAQIMLAVTVFSRMLAWCWQRRFMKTLVFGLIFISAAPHTVFFVQSLYPDALYSVAVIGLLFELWHATRTKRFSGPALLLVAVLFPCAIYARANGLVFLLSVAGAAILLDRAERTRLLIISLAWIGLMTVASQTRNQADQGAVFPLTVFETVNFLQPHPMDLWQDVPPVTDKALKALEKYATVKQMVESFDRDYWDTLVFKSNGPQLGRMSEDDRNMVASEFFRKNVWRNMPAFLASRVNVFLVASFAKGGFPSYAYTKEILSRIQSDTRYRPFGLQPMVDVLFKVSEWNYKYRWLLWTPFLGFILLFITVNAAIKKKDMALAMVGVPLLLHLIAIFLMSTAGEYRYLLMYSLLPVLLLPILISTRSNATR